MPRPRDPNDFDVTSAGLTYEIRTQGDFDRLFQGIVDDFKSIPWEDFLQAETRAIEKLHDSYFQTRAGSFYSAVGGWAPNAQSTIKKKGHARPLFGIPSKGFRLHKSLTQPQSEFGIREAIDQWPNLAEIIFGTDAPYHAFNEYGTSRIPARPHLGLTPEFFSELTDRAIDYAFRTLVES